MEAEYWVLSIFAIVVALAAGFIGGRMSAPRQRRVEAMERERDAARDEAEAVRAEVNRHFEESARMFGKLASDYRTFFQQFAETAQNLGLSEGRARELLHQADPSLVSRQSGQAERVADAEPPGAANEASASATATDGPSAGEEGGSEQASGQETGTGEARTDAAQRPEDAAEPAGEAKAGVRDEDETAGASAATTEETEEAAESGPGTEPVDADGRPRTPSS